MPWAPGPGLGFTTGTPWLPHGRNRTDADTVAAQTGNAAAPLERTRAMLAARRTLPALRDDAPAHWLTDYGPVIAVERGREVGRGAQRR
jgi:alpha-glucosidase